jgi:hypothetical protein
MDVTKEKLILYLGKLFMPWFFLGSTDRRSKRGPLQAPTAGGEPAEQPGGEQSMSCVGGGGGDQSIVIRLRNGLHLIFFFSTLGRDGQ